MATVACIVAASTTARAQQPRIRTLVYEPQQKEWVEQPPPPAGTAEGDLYAIQVQIHDGHYRRALSAIKRFVNNYGEADPAYPEALIAKAEALIGLKNYDKAHEVLQAYLGEFGGMTLTAEALRLEFIIAEAYLSGVKRRVWLVFRLSGEDLAYQILDEISSDYPESTLAELAVKTKADHPCIGCCHPDFPFKGSLFTMVEHGIVTGQGLDDHHARQSCTACHTDNRFDRPPTCNECHGEDEGISFPARRPGPVVPTRSPE